MSEQSKVIEGTCEEKPELEVPLILFYDSETTVKPVWGKPSESEKQPHLVQLAAVLCNEETREIIQSIDLIIKPDGWEIPQETVDVHGITTEYAEKVGVNEGFAVALLHQLRGDADRAAYNKTFDQRMIRIAMKRYMTEEAIEKWAAKDDHHCSMRMAQKHFGGKNMKLAEAYFKLTGKKLEKAHSAMADTLACMEVYFALKDLGQ